MSPKQMSDEGVPLTTVNRQELRLKENAQNMGKIGVWLGSRENAAVHIAGFITVLLIVIAGLIGAFGGEDRLEMVKLFGSFSLAAIGYLFGSLSGRK